MFNIILWVSSPILVRPDIDLLPVDQIPIQGIFTFLQPPTPIATAYLSAICRAESTQPDEHFFSALQASSTVDLRWCINQCQFGGSVRSLGTTPPQETTRDDWEDALGKRAGFPQWVSPPLGEPQHQALFSRLAKHTDSISYLDSCLVLRVDAVSELLAFGGRELLNPVVPLCDTGLAEPSAGG